MTVLSSLSSLTLWRLDKLNNSIYEDYWRNICCTIVESNKHTNLTKSLEIS